MYAPQPNGLDWESTLRREETGLPEENPRGQVEIDWNSTHIQSNPDNSGEIEKGSSYREFELLGVENKWPERRKNDDAVHFYSYNAHFNCNLIGSGKGGIYPSEIMFQVCLETF